MTVEQITRLTPTDIVSVAVRCPVCGAEFSLRLNGETRLSKNLLENDAKCPCGKAHLWRSLEALEHDPPRDLVLAIIEIRRQAGLNEVVISAPAPALPAVP